MTKPEQNRKQDVNCCSDKYLKNNGHNRWKCDHPGEINDEITDKAKEISEVSSLNSQIRNQEKTIERCYNEIGKLYYEAHKDDTSDAFLEQIERITKAKQEVERLKKDVENIKNK